MLFCKQIFLKLKFKQEFLRNSSTIFRSNHQRYTIQKAVPKNFMIFTEKTTASVESVF